MKCVRIVGQGVPYRMSNEEAFQIVDRDHDGEYCSKDFWKGWYAKPDPIATGDLPSGAAMSAFLKSAPVYATISPTGRIITRATS